MSWLKNQFVPTAAAQLLQRLAVEVAGHNCVVGVTARRGFGKSFLARQVMALASGLGIKNRIAYVEFWGEEENTNAVLRRIAVGVGWNHEDVRLMGTSQLFDCIVEFIHRNKVDLMFPLPELPGETSVSSPLPLLRVFPESFTGENHAA